VNTLRTDKEAPLKTPIGGPFAADDGHLHRLGSMQTVDFLLRRHSENTEVDYLIVGIGAAGGVLLQRLARAGFEVVGMEAGPFWDTERDWVSDEAGSHQLYWEDLRITGGKKSSWPRVQQLRQRRRRRIRALGSVHFTFSPVGL
jgi:hypothetical protein